MDDQPCSSGHRTPPARRVWWLPLALIVVSAQPTPGHSQAVTEKGAFSEGVLPETISTVAIHPPSSDRFRLRETLTCQQHAVHKGDPVILGDAAGMDCMMIRFDAGQTSQFPRAYGRDGAANEDWYAWGAPLFAPFDGVVEEVSLNPVTNRPGARGEGRASSIVFRRADGMRVVYGHVAGPRVEARQRIVAGQTVARIGNNGFGWFPHVHIGAWKGSEPVQIAIDARALGLLQEKEPSAGPR